VPVTPDRLALANSLRDLADFIDTNPDIPVPCGPVSVHYISLGSDEEIRADIDRIAAYLGTSIDPADLAAGHYATSISFGKVTYRAVGILAHARAQHEANLSYHGCIAPDPVDGDTLDGSGDSSATSRHDRGND
jgi:hypothetical protein